MARVAKSRMLNWKARLKEENERRLLIKDTLNNGCLQKANIESANDLHSHSPKGHPYHALLFKVCIAQGLAVGEQHQLLLPLLLLLSIFVHGKAPFLLHVCNLETHVLVLDPQVTGIVSTDPYYSS